jgi:hypothetical protein
VRDTVDYIDFMESAATVSPVGATRMRRRGAALETSVDGAAYALPAAATAAAATTSAALTGATTTVVTTTEVIAAARAVAATGVKADASDDTLPPVGVTVAGAGDASPCTVVTHGPAAVLSAATPGTKYWLSETTGVITATKPSTTGNALWLLGIAVSATVLYVQLSYLGTVPA